MQVRLHGSLVLTCRAISAFASLALAASNSALMSASFFAAARSLCTAPASSCFSSPFAFLSSCKISQTRQNAHASPDAVLIDL